MGGGPVAHPPGEGPLWLAIVRDAFSRRIVGWKASDRADTDLVLGALEYALWSRDLDHDQLVFHNDRGCQRRFKGSSQHPEQRGCGWDDHGVGLLRRVDAGARPSMGSVGDSLDNALAENFFSILKVERVYRTSYHTREEAELDLFVFIDGWYNPRRIQRELGWRSPDEYEQAYSSSTADALTSPTSIS
jgi:putative transposase